MLALVMYVKELRNLFITMIIIIITSGFFCSLTLHRKFGRRTPIEPCLLLSAGVM